MKGSRGHGHGLRGPPGAVPLLRARACGGPLVRAGGQSGAVWAATSRGSPLKLHSLAVALALGAGLRLRTETRAQEAPRGARGLQSPGFPTPSVPGHPLPCHPGANVNSHFGDSAERS